VLLVVDDSHVRVVTLEHSTVGQPRELDLLHGVDVEAPLLAADDRNPVGDVKLDFVYRTDNLVDGLDRKVCNAFVVADYAVAEELKAVFDGVEYLGLKP